MTAVLFALYFYSGIANTPQSAYHTEATFRMGERPTCAYNQCHTVAWTVLWDRGRSGQFVEAGVGYIPRFQCEGTSLWVATPQTPGGEEVACVPSNTWIAVYIDKRNGEALATVWWFWQDNHIDKTIELPNWVNGPGISPTKVEIYTSGKLVYPVHIEVHAASSAGTMQSSPEYPLSPGGSSTYLEVKVP